VNIGDIGHTPGALRLLEQYVPEAEVTLWPSELGHGSRELLTAAFPRLRIAMGTLGPAGTPQTLELARAWDEADLYLSGSGSGFPAHQHAAAFHRATGKPVGVFGVSTDPVSGFGEGREPEGGTLEALREKALALPQTHLQGDMRYVLDHAAFFFCRDTISRDYLRAQRVKTPILEFGPDAQLGMHLRDDEKGDAYRKAHGLDSGRFICVIPRLRYTPYYRIRNVARTPADDVRDAINERTTATDHARVRDLIVAYVRHTGNTVLACAEMTYQIELARDELVDPLPADVKPRVVWRDTYWLPDEAASIYAHAEAVVSMECHSPLIALRNGTPAFYVRQPTDTTKGQMYRDFGAGDWFFEIEETSGAALWSRLQAVHDGPAAARAKVRTIMAGIEARQRRMVEAVRTAALHALNR
jgi:polysaccharide pyruvyl transferase WcaK-like protein